MFGNFDGTNLETAETRLLCYIVWFAPVLVGLMDKLQNIDIISWLFPILATDKLLFRYAN